jgi:hypothetical protein
LFVCLAADSEQTDHSLRVETGEKINVKTPDNYLSKGRGRFPPMLSVAVF